MTLDDLKEIMGEKRPAELIINGHCHDCKKDLKVIVQLFADDSVKLYGGVPFRVTQKDIGEKQTYIKCPECYEKDKVLRNWQRCEVYSRVVGYLRPVSQWNEGKKQEYTERAEMKVEEEGKDVS